MSKNKYISNSIENIFSSITDLDIDTDVKSVDAAGGNILHRLVYEISKRRNISEFIKTSSKADHNQMNEEIIKLEAIIEKIVSKDMNVFLLKKKDNAMDNPLLKAVVYDDFGSVKIFFDNLKRYESHDEYHEIYENITEGLISEALSHIKINIKMLNFLIENVKASTKEAVEIYDLVNRASETNEHGEYLKLINNFKKIHHYSKKDEEITLLYKTNEISHKELRKYSLSVLNKTLQKHEMTQYEYEYDSSYDKIKNFIDQNQRASDEFIDLIKNKENDEIIEILKNKNLVGNYNKSIIHVLMKAIEEQNIPILDNLDLENQSWHNFRSLIKTLKNSENHTPTIIHEKLLELVPENMSWISGLNRSRVENQTDKEISEILLKYNSIFQQDKYVIDIKKLEALFIKDNKSAELLINKLEKLDDLQSNEFEELRDIIKTVPKDFSSNEDFIVLNKTKIIEVLKYMTHPKSNMEQVKIVEYSNKQENQIINDNIKKLLELSNNDQSSAFRHARFLVEAVETKDLNLMKQYTSGYRTWVNGQDSKGNSAIMNAIISENEEILDRLLRLPNIDLEIENKEGNTALMLAIEKGDINILNKLINAKADINTLNYNNDTPLTFARRILDNPKYNESQSQEKIDPKAIEKYEKAIKEHRTKYKKIIETIIKHYKNLDILNLQDKNGKTVLITAIEKGHIDIAQQIIKLGAHLNIQDNDGKTALITAIEKGHIDIAQQIIESGEHLNIQDNDGKTALIIAIERGHIDIAQQIIESGAHLNIQDNDGKTALIIAIERGHIYTVQELIKKGADVKSKNCYEESILMLAVKTGNAELVEQIIKAGAIINHENRTGDRALTYAVEKGDINIIQQLIEAKADLNFEFETFIDIPHQGSVSEGFKSPLSIALKNSNINIAKMLIEAGAEICFGKSGSNSLSEAIRTGDKELISIVIYNMKVEQNDQVKSKLLKRVFKSDISEYDDELFKNLLNIVKDISKDESRRKLVSQILLKNSEESINNYDKCNSRIEQIIEYFKEGDIDILKQNKNTDILKNRERVVKKLINASTKDIRYINIFKKYLDIFLSKDDQKIRYEELVKSCAEKGNIDSINKAIETFQKEFSNIKYDINSKYNNNTVLIYTIINNNFDAFKELINDSNVDLNIKVNNKTALQHAMDQRKPNMVKELASLGANIDKTTRKSMSINKENKGILENEKAVKGKFNENLYKAFLEFSRKRESGEIYNQENLRELLKKHHLVKEENGFGKQKVEISKILENFNYEYDVNINRSIFLSLTSERHQIRSKDNRQFIKGNLDYNSHIINETAKKKTER